MGDTLSLKFTFADPSGNVAIPISGPFLVVAVDWGDGSPISGLSHTYDASGTYTAVVSTFASSATSFGTDGWAGVANLTDVSTNNPATWGLGGAVTSFQYLFKGATALISVPSNVPPSVTNMSFMFTDASSFNQDISGWNVSNVQTMLLMFAGATSFNKNLTAWDVSRVDNTSNMFASATAFNNGGVALSWGNKTRNFSIMSGMFSSATAFNQAIGDWNVGSATLMEGMFQFASAFDQDIGGWNVSGVSNMKLMFNGASAFNQDISDWDVSSVTTMDQMFQADTSFNRNIRKWAVQSGTNLSNMFNGASAFQLAYYGTSPGYDTDPNTPLYTFFSYSPPPTQYPCFLEGSKILCFENNEEVYRPIESLRKGDLVKTIYNGYMPIHIIGTTSIYNPGNDYRVVNRLYKCSREKYPALFEDLYITGCHSTLVPWMTNDQWENTKAVNGNIYVTDNHFRLIACADEKAEPYDYEGFVNIYHIALEHCDILMNYGIYANGLLVESCSERNLRYLSNMRILGEEDSALYQDINNVSNNITRQLVYTR
jgi:surface protein